MKKLLYILFLVFQTNTFAKSKDAAYYVPSDNSAVVNRITNDDIIVTVPAFTFTFIDADIKIKFKNPRHGRLIVNDDKIHFIIDGEDKELTFIKGEAHFIKKIDIDRRLTIYTEGFSYSKTIMTIPVWALLLTLIIILYWGIRRFLKK